MRKSRYKNFKLKRQKSLKTNRLLKAFVFLVVSILTLVLLFIFWKLKTLQKFAYVNNNNGSVEIIVIDPQKETSVKISIDPNMMFESSRNFGQYRLDNLWILGRKEKYQGKLVVETIAKNFSLPIYLWKDGNTDNLSIFQRIKLFLLKTKKDDYDYRLVSEKVNGSILVNFVDPNISESLPKVRIQDLTGNGRSAEVVSKILETIGFKTVDYVKGYDTQLDCMVIGKNEEYIGPVSRIFDCDKVVDVNQSVDLEIRIGKIFADRF